MKTFEIYHERITDLCTQSIPKRIGAYVIVHTKDNIHAEKYVGSTTNLCNRRHGHYNKGIIYIDLYMTDYIEFAQSLERVLMKLIEPTTNKIIPSLYDEDNELMNEVLENDKLKELILDNTIKIRCRYLKCNIRIENDRNPKVTIIEDNIPKNVRIEQRTITRTKKGAILSLNMKYLNEIGLNAGKYYTVIYDDKKEELIITNKKIKAVTF